ncbi:MAG: peroxidase [Elusimicrobia bacterium]|nr:peroxidase [Elusimicrobiota bacterium]
MIKPRFAHAAFAAFFAAQCAAAPIQSAVTAEESAVGTLNAYWDGAGIPPQTPVVDATGPAGSVEHAPNLIAVSGRTPAPHAVPAPSSDAPPQTLPELLAYYANKAKELPADANSWIFRQVNRRWEWHKLPTVLAILNLEALRHDLRKHNLHGTHQLDPNHRRTDPASCERWRGARSPNGTCNDPNNPDMGRAEAPFGQNNPIVAVKPEPVPGDPDPREISRRLMTRKEFKPAAIVNNLAMIWIQSQVNDWVRHGRNQKDQIAVPRAGQPINGRDDVLDRVERVPGATGPANANKVTHWWDGSHLYGSSAETQAKVRSGSGGRLTLDGSGLLPIDESQRDTAGRTGIDQTGFNENYWAGLSMMHTLFAREHNAIADMFKAKHPEWTDDELFDKARLVNAALLAKIHTVEWTPAILQHPALQVGMKANWWGLGGVIAEYAGYKPQDFKNSWLGRMIKNYMPDALNDIVNGIPGGQTNHHGTDYSLTEQFDIVYRMHPLVPDSFEMHSATDGRHLGSIETKDMQGMDTRGVVNRFGMANLFYSMGISHPGAITLRNFPKSLQNFMHFSGRGGDLAAADIIRTRELGVPRYNDFRASLRMPRVATFEELTGGDKELAADMRDLYKGDVDKVDTIVGLFAEPPPQGFGFSDTAFRIFILMASRRLKSDRFLSVDYRPEIYTREGIDWVENNSMRSVLLRHHPELSTSLQGIDNVFKNTWKKVGGR